jgi:thiol-disulfide isomerase/thioredoxin
MNNSGYCFVRDFRKLKHTVNQVSPSFRKLKHTVNQVLPSFRKLKHTVNQVSPLRGFALLSRRDNTLLTVGEAQRNLRTGQPFILPQSRRDDTCCSETLHATSLPLRFAPLVSRILYFVPLFIIAIALPGMAVAQIPDNISRWIDSELANARQTTMMDFEAGEFFVQEDTARLVGYIRGYDPQAGASSGIIHAENLITREEYPRTIHIHEDGRFECNIPVQHPACLTANIENANFAFYIQPGQTLAMLLEWEDFPETGSNYKSPEIQFRGGALACLNRELKSFDDRLPGLNFGKIYEERREKSPEEFKTFYEEWIADYTKAYRKLLETQELSKDARIILENNYKIRYATYLFEYEMEYEMNHHDSPLPLAFYDFLQDIPLNDKHLFSTPDFSTFINRLEYCGRFLKVFYRMSEYMQWTPEKIAIEGWRMIDSVYLHELKLKPGIVYDAIKIRSLDNVLLGLINTPKEEVFNFLASFTTGIPESFLQKEAERLFHKNFPDNRPAAYSLPDTYEASIFKEIIAPFKGKVLLVDFWATSCSPCIYNIKQHKGLREKYKDSPDVAFLFITSEELSQKKRYDQFIAEQELEHTYWLSYGECNHLHQLFRFNAIPHYVLVDRDGNILNDNLSPHEHAEKLQEAIGKTEIETNL